MRQGPRDEDLMAMALDLARLGEGRTSPNPMVGAVIVRKGRVIGRGFHRGSGQPHAEIDALNAVCTGGVTPPLQGATLYVSLEPCCPPKPGGRTPPCTDAILKSGIKQVVIGMKDPDPRMSGRGIAILRRAGLEVRVGVLEKEGLALNEAYVMHRTKKRPFVLLKMAMTADGKVGILGRRCKITGPEADAQVHALRDRVDAILVGIGTVLADDPRLTTRLKRGKGKDPIRVVLDGRRRIPPKAKILNLKSTAPTWSATMLTKIRSVGRRVDLPSLLRELARRGVMSLLVEGGPRVWTSFLEQKLVDRIALFLSPRRLGDHGLPALSSVPEILKGAVPDVLALGRDVLMEADFK